MTTLRFYNSLTKTVERFKPRDAGHVRVYNCGPTVYRRQHLGNLRRFLFADFLRRALEFSGFAVDEITNITDVGHLTEDDLDAGEDKLEKAARQTQRTPQDIARAQTKLFFEDLAALGVQEARAYPRASEYIPAMIELVEKLLERGHAYRTSTGVYFDVSSFERYGALSGNKLEQLAAGKRVEIRQEKRHPADFALWVLDDKHLQTWKSPWGVGYPGWHLECSAMSLHFLGSDIDIHTGGEDNRFPHHENEIAQSEGATGESFVRYWMHNRHLQMDGKKLAKRAGQQVTLATLQKKGYSPLAFRLLVFASHYRSPMDFSWEAMDEATENLKTLQQVVRRLMEADGAVQGGTPDSAVVEAFGKTLADDLNTPQALAVLLEYVKHTNALLDAAADTPVNVRDLWATLLALDSVVGVLAALQQELAAEAVPPDVERLAAQRQQARLDHDFVAADQLRSQIEAKGYTVEDTEHDSRIIPL